MMWRDIRNLQDDSDISTAAMNKWNFLNETALKDRYLTTNFIRRGQETLKLCRLTLMYSYAFEYTWTSVDNQIIFLEQNLKSLENFTENLYDILENLSSGNILEKQTELIDCTELCKKSHQLIINHIREGETKGWWIEYSIIADCFDWSIVFVLRIIKIPNSLYL